MYAECQLLGCPMNVELIFAVLTHVLKYGWRIDWTKGGPGFSVVECRDRPGLQADSEGGTRDSSCLINQLQKKEAQSDEVARHIAAVLDKGGAERLPNVSIVFFLSLL